MRRNFKFSDNSPTRNHPMLHHFAKNLPGANVESNTSGGADTSSKYKNLLRDRLNATVTKNFGGRNVTTLNYGAITPKNKGTPPVVPTPVPISQPVTNPAALKPSTTPETKPAVPTKPVVLIVKNVNLKISANGAVHHTNRYAISAPNKPNPILVVRRGQSFNIDIEFSRPYDEKADDLKLIFEAGNNPLPAKGTYVEFILSDEDKPKEWGAKITSNAGNFVSADIFTPPTCLIGKWALKIDVIKTKRADVNILRYQHKDQIYIIFNPWCSYDTVYMSDVQLLTEYVLNETGLIYQGSKEHFEGRPWNFGQNILFSCILVLTWYLLQTFLTPGNLYPANIFESCVLDLAFYLLDVSELNWAVRGNPIPIIRKIAALVNSEDDGGILTGRWEGDFSDGTPPLTWTGSVAILDQYWKTRQSVRYGQCWVFSGVATTLCRSLGIPARSVTNFESAHDSDGSITIDYHYEDNGHLNEDDCRDKIWNFHVWNECYMSRPDLPPGYGGWQVFDATPQETSDGVYCVGPTSVIAIKNGQVNLPYDGPYVFAEINGDEIWWKRDRLGAWKLADTNKTSIGYFISTKAVNSNDRLDITDTYKHAEDSPEERAAVIKANQVGSNKQNIYKKTVDDVKLNIIQDSANNWVGSSFHVGINMKNNSTGTRTISGRIIVESMFYNGLPGNKLKSEPFTNIVLPPGQEKKQMIEVKQDDYIGKLKDCCMLNALILGQVTETEQSFIIKESYTLRKPHLSVKAPSETMAGKEFKIDASFTNPFKSSLTGCVLSVDGVCPVIKFPQGNVAPSGTFTATVPITPKKVGKHEIIIIFNSVQLEDINASCPITIRE